jgi:hypothetical protein
MSAIDRRPLPDGILSMNTPTRPNMPTSAWPTTLDVLGVQVEICRVFKDEVAVTIRPGEDSYLRKDEVVVFLDGSVAASTPATRPPHG